MFGSLFIFAKSKSKSTFYLGWQKKNFLSWLAKKELFMLAH
jgi:hypothetical protein